METSARRNVDFAFLFTEAEFEEWFDGNIDELRKTVCAEGLEASLIFKGSVSRIYFELKVNNQVIDSTMLKSWQEIDVFLKGSSDGKNFGMSYGEVELKKIAKVCCNMVFEYVIDTEEMSDDFWAKRETKISADVSIPNEAFLADSNIDGFEKTPLEEALLKDDQTMDFTLVSTKDGGEVKCHRSILNVSGEFFKKVLNDSLNPGKHRSRAELPFSIKTLEVVKTYVYRRKAEFYSDGNMTEILDAGTMMFLPGLVKQAEEYLIKEMNNHDKWDMLVLARKYDLQRLKNRIFPLAAKDPAFREKIEKIKDFDLILEYTKYLMDAASQE